MAAFTISATGKSASGIHCLAGGKHSFAHSLACAALADSGIVHDVPNITDSETLIEALRFIFNDVIHNHIERTLQFSNPKRENNIILSKEFLGKSRNLFCLLPALLLRSTYVTFVGDPQGCSIGIRPTDWYVSVLEKFGVIVKEEPDNSKLILSWPEKKSASIDFAYPTMTGTVIAIAAAAVTPGISIISGPSVEPSCDDQMECCRSMGVSVKKEAEKLVINGKKSISPANYHLTADRVHAVTIITAALLTRGSVTLKSNSPIRIPEFIKFLQEIGVQVSDEQSSITAQFPAENNFLRPINLVGGSEPLFSSDWVSFAALLMATRSIGISTISDNVFLKRFQFSQYLGHNGLENLTTKITNQHGRETVVAEIDGHPNMILPGGKPALCPDIRGSAAIMLSALTSSNPVVIEDDFQLRRGYEDLGNDLMNLGIAQIKKEVA